MAFVHLHNHSDFSLLDAATRVDDMVQRAVEFGMPAIALTDHGYMYGVPDFDLACSSYNQKTGIYQQWERDIEAIRAGQEPPEPEPDAPGSGFRDRAHDQWQRDRERWGRAHQEADVVAPTIKPIFGCEAYFITDDMIEKVASTQHRFHLILLAKDETGYHNLMKMMSEAAIAQFYYKPRTTLDMLRRYHEGIICTSACVQGIIQQRLMESNEAEAERWARTYQEIFGEDFYLEIQDHGLTFQNGFTDRTLDEAIVALARRLGIKVVATNDVHYLQRDQAQTQLVLDCIGKAVDINDTSVFHMQGDEFYLKDEGEMRSLFDWCPEACDNTLEIAGKCDYRLDWSHMYLPKFPDLEEGETSEERFRKECEKGLERRYGKDWRNVTINGINVEERYEHEAGIIIGKGFADYFLIVQEYVQWAKRNGIGVGPGRGSAAGAIVAYAMDITTFDPLENGLLFERFLSPQRSEMPDIDMDFDDERRLEVVQHVRELYGSDRVCHVITYSTIKAKQAINDAARVLGQPIRDAQRLSKMVSNSPSVKLSDVLHKSAKHPEFYNPDFEQAYRTDADARRIIDTALSIEGLTRGEGVHACAVLITPTPVNDHVPTKLDTKGGVEITQYEGHSIADMGLLKMDFLGLRTLTVISKARENIKANHGIDVDVDAIPFDDPAIFKLMGEGRTAGVFQIESGGMTATIKQMQPTEYKQVVALIALYRPGPLGAGMVTDYIDRMHGRKEVVYYDDRLADILSETYGTIVYQEQVMQISMRMCGFSAGESDSRIRKPVAKKKIKLLTDTVFEWEDGHEETTYDHWMNGAERNGYSRQIAQRIWDDVLEFASYAFNKSHSAGYAILVMQTAWLKAHYPREYMAAVLTSYMGKTDKIVHYVNACRHEGIQILPPDINESGRDFTAVPEGIRFGFAGIRGVGEGAADCIIAEREAGGPFKSLHDFCDRVDASQANRRVVEALIKAGAFDSTGYTRMQLAHFVDKNNPENVIDAAAKRQRDRASGQGSLFDLFGDVAGSGFEAQVPPPDGQEWDRHVKLAQEKDVLGIYVSDHPLRPYEYALSKARDYTLSELDASMQVAGADGGEMGEVYKVRDGSDIWVAGMVSNLVQRTTKNGDFMATVTLEDMEGELNCVVFPKSYKKYRDLLLGRASGQEGEGGDVFVRMRGRLERDDRGTQLLVSEIEPIQLDEASNRPKVFEVMMSSRLLNRSFMERLSDVFSRYGGLDRVELRVEESSGDTMRMELPTKVDASNMILFGEVMELLQEDGRVVVA
jgi:DNA polymerase-3 subunit alpha